MHGLVRHTIKQGQSHPGNANAYDKGKQRHQRRFTQKLEDQFLAPGSQHLSYSDFPGPVGRAGCREVHKIDAGDQQDEQRHGRKDVDVLNISSSYVCLEYRWIWVNGMSEYSSIFPDFLKSSMLLIFMIC